MGSFAERAKANASRQINDKGDTVRLTSRYDCVYDPATGEDVCTEDIYDIKGVISNYDITEIDDTNVQGDDLRCLIQFVLRVDDTWVVTYQNKTWQVITSTQTRTQNSTIVQALQIRALG